MMIMSSSSSTEPSVNEIMRLGNQYAVNKQWEHAGNAFARALDTLYQRFMKEGSSTLSDEAIQLYNDLEKGDAPNEGPVINLEGVEVEAYKKKLSAIPELRDQMERTDGLLKVGIFRFTCFFRRSSSVWTIVFYKEKTKTYGHGDPINVTVSYPAGTSAVLVLSRTQCRWLRPAVAAQMSYAWAHRAEAATHYTMMMYQVNEILLHESNPAIALRREDYQRALLLNPSSHWTLARLGESYRHVANSFTARDAVYRYADDRLKWHVTAIVYFRAAIDLVVDLAVEPKEQPFWTFAHLGASITNMRAFIGWSTRDPKILKDLLEDWPESWPTDKGLPIASGLSIDADANRAFANKAVKMLIRAMEIQGYYYPWAQIYYSGALLIKGAFTKDHRVAHLGQILTGIGYYLDPRALDNSFEPGQLGVNSMFESAAIYHCLGDYRSAWQYVWIGMKWLFKFNFQPGLYGLTGCVILVNLASDYMDWLKNPVAHVRQESHASADYNLIPAAAFPERPALDALDGISSMDLPIEPFTDSKTLCQFIESAYVRYIKAHVGPWLMPHVELDSNVIVGLTTTLFIIERFLKVLQHHSPVGGDMNPLVQDLERCMNEILCKTGMTLEPAEPDQWHQRPISLSVIYILGHDNIKRLRAATAAAGGS